MTYTVIEIDDLSYQYPSAPAPTLHGLSFAVAPGEFVSVVGPSGAGKTTLLNCMSGLTQPTGGEVRLDGERVTEPSTRIAVVFQDYSRSLFPWMTAEKNIALPLKSRGLHDDEARDRVRESLSVVGLTKHGSKYPWELSGGMQQRVAIARALALQPHLFIMDEPMASVDAQTRTDLEDLVLGIWAERRISVVFVTHDIDEAIYMADRVVVLSTPPTTVHQVLDIPLTRPRDQIRTKEDPQFARLRAHLFEQIRVLRSRQH